MERTSEVGIGHMALPPVVELLEVPLDFRGPSRLLGRHGLGPATPGRRQPVLQPGDLTVVSMV
jgi:hypothetical protein